MKLESDEGAGLAKVTASLFGVLTGLFSINIGYNECLLCA